MNTRLSMHDTLWSAALLVALAGCGQDPLSFAIQPIPVHPTSAFTTRIAM